jgi:hypothetical protein
VSECTRFEVAVTDPPLLRALLLASGNDQEVKAIITRAYHGALEGAKGSPWVMSAVLQSAIGNAILVRLDGILESIDAMQARSLSNGSKVPETKPAMTTAQFNAIRESILALPSKADIQSMQEPNGSGRALTTDDRRLLEDCANALKQRPGATSSDAPWYKWGWRIGIPVATLILGGVLTWTFLQDQAHARVVEVQQRMQQMIAAQPTVAGRVQSALWARGGRIEIVPGNITIAGGDIKLGNPVLYTDNAVRIPTN